jgi:transcriptional regulator with XRE-family HTH domain
MARNPVVEQILERMRELRENAGISPTELDKMLILGPGWTARFESGDTVPSLDMLTVMLDALGSDLHELISGIAKAPLKDTTTAVARFIHAETDLDDMFNGLLVHFQYADHDATYRLEGATEDEFEEVIKTLRDGLAQLVGEASETQQAIKTNAVARAYLKAVELWPDANPSDLWWFVVSRAYLDTFNHPARYARLDLGQSWKRTGGWALEEILVRHYGPSLAQHGIGLFIANGDEKQRFLAHLEVSERLEADKVDVLLVGETDDGPVCFGVVHVKASLAERRTDDVPLSKPLVDAGYTSPLWTMDSKSTPAAEPRNRGELGPAYSGGIDDRSAKRKDIEEDGYFSACFSYNANTVPTPEGLDVRARIFACDFKDPTNDAFTRFIRESWEKFREKNLAD